MEKIKNSRIFRKGAQKGVSRQKPILELARTPEFQKALDVMSGLTRHPFGRNPERDTKIRQLWGSDY